MSGKKSVSIIAGIVILIALVAGGYLSAGKASAFSTGAPAAHCGAPADAYDNCTQCHSSYPVNTIVNAITSTVPPNGYVPLSTYTITATINKPGHTRYGFEISPQDLAGNLLGSMNDVSSETTFTGLGKYITHSTTGTTGIDSKTWQFEWTAPAAGTGSVTFYGAFNVTNNDGGPVGDSIFMTTYTVNEDLSNSVASQNTSVTGLKTWIDMNGILHVSYRPLYTSNDRILVSDLSGRNTGTFIPVSSVNNTRELEADVTSMPEGIYIVTIENSIQPKSEKILIVH